MTASARLRVYLIALPQQVLHDQPEHHQVAPDGRQPCRRSSDRRVPRRPTGFGGPRRPAFMSTRVIVSCDRPICENISRLSTSVPAKLADSTIVSTYRARPSRRCLGRRSGRGAARRTRRCAGTAPAGRARPSTKTPRAPCCSVRAPRSSSASSSALRSTIPTTALRSPSRPPPPSAATGGREPTVSFHASKLLRGSAACPASGSDRLAGVAAPRHGLDHLRPEPEDVAAVQLGDRDRQQAAGLVLERLRRRAGPRPGSRCETAPRARVSDSHSTISADLRIVGVSPIRRRVPVRHHRRPAAPVNASRSSPCLTSPVAKCSSPAMYASSFAVNLLQPHPVLVSAVCSLASRCTREHLPQEIARRPHLERHVRGVFGGRRSGPTARRPAGSRSTWTRPGPCYACTRRGSARRSAATRSSGRAAARSSGSCAGTSGDGRSPRRRSAGAG